VSRYFKYKTAADLDRDARTLGLDIRLTDDHSPLLRPLDVGGRRLGNRLAIQPMEGCDATPDGSPDELTVRRFRRFGAGGAKLIWGEAAAVRPEARANPRQLVIDAAHVDGLARLAETCKSAHRAAFGHADDLLIGLQLTHSGRYSVPRPILAHHDPALDPLTVVDRATGATAGPDYPLITDAELDRLQDTYVEAAALAYRAGFDFVDLKSCHRYLLSELLSAETRPGRYGGPFENRTRFLREVAGRIRDRHPSAILATRLNVYDGLPHGVERSAALVWGARRDDPAAFDGSEPIRLVGMLRDLCVTLINVTAGNPYASAHLLRPFEYAPPDAYETPEHPLIGVDRHFRITEAIQASNPEVVTIGSGYSWLQAFLPHAGAANVRDGRVSLVGVGRASLSHPDFGRHVMEGRPLDPKRTCRTFSYCTALMRSKHHPLGQFPAGCPPFDKAEYGPIWAEAKATQPKTAGVSR